MIDATGDSASISQNSEQPNLEAEAKQTQPGINDELVACLDETQSESKVAKHSTEEQWVQVDMITCISWALNGLV